jgi:thioredoxin 1
MTFDEIIRSNKNLLVDFSAEWCGPCKTLAPILKEVKKEIGNSATIIKIDVDKNPQTAATWQVQSVPTLVLFVNGQPVWRQSGLVPKHVLVDLIKKNVS